MHIRQKVSAVQQQRNEGTTNVGVVLYFRVRERRGFWRHHTAVGDVKVFVGFRYCALHIPAANVFSSTPATSHSSPADQRATTAKPCGSVSRGVYHAADPSQSVAKALETIVQPSTDVETRDVHLILTPPRNAKPE